MNDSTPRREFLCRALAACGAPFLARMPVVAAPQESPALPNSPAEVSGTEKTSSPVDAYFGEGGREAVRTIAEAYRRSLSIDESADAVRAAAAGTLELISGAPTEAAALKALATAVRRDFQESRIVQLDGWILSRTESELCLLSLLQ